MSDVLVEGSASGELMVLTEPLSFWGGVDPGTGEIIDGSHPAVGESVTAKIVFMPHGRGSSSSASVIAESIRSGTGPVGFILGEPDDIVVTGVFVANSLYGTRVPVVITELPRNTGGRFNLGVDGCHPVQSE